MGAFLPGVPQIVSGRRGVGGAACLVWFGLWAIVIWRADRVASAWEAGWDSRVALVTLALSLAATWLWSWRDLRPRRRSGGEKASRGSPWLERFARSPAAVAGLWAISILGLAALLGPLIAPFDPNVQGNLVTERFLPPSTIHPLGTDNLARDVLSRLLYGARVSLLVGFLAVGISASLGTVLGAVAGYAGGAVDGVLMRLVDMVLAFPRLVLLIVLVAVLEPSLLVIVTVLGLTLWPSTARLVRGEVLSLREREFVVAARALGYSRYRILFRHLLPNALGPVIVAATLGVGDTIVLEAGLSFLGLGVQPPTASWGSMVDAGRVNLLGAWWISTFPGLAIVLTVVALNLVGDGLRDALDPRTRS